MIRKTADLNFNDMFSLLMPVAKTAAGFILGRQRKHNFQARQPQSEKNVPGLWVQSSRKVASPQRRTNCAFRASAPPLRSLRLCGEPTIQIPTIAGYQAHRDATQRSVQ